LVRALTAVATDDDWLVDAALAAGPNTVALDLARSRRWVDPSALGERPEVFVHAAKLSRNGDCTADELLMMMNAKAVEWEESRLDEVTARRLDAAGRTWWRVGFRSGGRRRGGVSVFTEHQHIVTAMAWHPSSRLVASGDAGGNVFVWNPETGDAESRLYSGHGGQVSHIGWNDDGIRLATASSDGVVLIGEPGSDNPLVEVIHALQENEFLVAVVWDRGQLATTSSDGTTHYWDLNTPTTPTATLQHPHPEDVMDVAWNHNRTSLATLCRDGALRIWEPTLADNPLATLALGTDNVGSPAWNHDGTRLAIVAWSGDPQGYLEPQVLIWDVSRFPNHQAPITLTPDTGPREVAWIGDSGRLATVGETVLSIWDLAIPDAPLATVVDGSPAGCAAWNTDGTRLAIASDDGCVHLWDPNVEADGPEVAGVKHDGWVTDLAWNHTGEWLASAGNDGEAYIWDPSDSHWPQITLHHDEMVTAVAWNHDSTRIATAVRADDWVRLWDIDDTEQPYDYLNHQGFWLDLAWNHSGTRLASRAFDGLVSVWDLPDHHKVTLARPGYTWPSGVASARTHGLSWDRAGERLATAVEEGVLIWDPNTPNHPLATLPHADYVQDLAWNSDGTCLATASGHTTRIWHLSDPGRHPTELQHNRGVVSVAWNPSGIHLATGSWDRTVEIWDPTTPDHPTHILLHDDPVKAVAWNPNGTHLATGTWDGTILIWHQRPPLA
jgi:WD40 repeat protein